MYLNCDDYVEVQDKGCIFHPKKTFLRKLNTSPPKNLAFQCQAQNNNQNRKKPNGC